MKKYGLTWFILIHITGSAISVQGGYRDSISNVLPAVPGDKAAKEGRKDGEPTFEEVLPRNVTALVGMTAYLSCRVRNLGNKTVSWIRHHDLHILTVNSYTYTSDQRFMSSFDKEVGEWTLHIKWVQLKDEGMYECQVSTQPIKSYFVYLKVIGTDRPRRPSSTYLAQLPRPGASILEEIYHTMYADQVPTASISGAPDVHFHKGSTINLTCIVRYTHKPPDFITWFHKEQLLTQESDRGGIYIETERGEESTTSTLLVQRADPVDAGRYACNPSNADMAVVRVHVLSDEMPAAMQTASAGLSSSARHIPELLVLSALYCRLLQVMQLPR